ncbi:MAG: DUF4493 domain-containing protein, partial [Muribaculaceae bacterium]|nr:DUF4493 domain-containing protein [Muribaculaceae bacterium]
MNSKILTIAAAATILASACDNWTPPVSPDGKADLSSVAITNDDAVKIIANDHVGRADDVDLSQYIVHVYSVDDPATPLYTWTYASMPEVITIPAATYRIGVESHSVAKAEWERPYFYGTSDAFTVEAGKIAKAGDVVCTFQSIRVSVRYDEDVLPLLGDDVAVTVKANDEGSLVFTANETRSGYFQFVAGSTTMAVNFHGTIDGALIDNDFTFTDLAPGQHRIISIHRKLSPTPPEQTGDINPAFGIDLGVTTEDIDGNVTIEEESQTVKNPFEEGPEQGGSTDPDPGKDPV